jgi:tetratricopeptide (TPR) repeat protein
MSRITSRTLRLCCLIAWSAICPAQERRVAPEQQPEPAQLQLEPLRVPQALASLVTARRWDEVLKTSLQGISETPRNPILHYWAGVARFHQRDFVESVLSLRSAEKLGLDTAPLHEALGITYYAIHQHTLFLQQMEAAIRADPEGPAPYHYVGRYYEHDINDYLKAISYFDKALERDAGDFKSLHFRAFCFQMLGRDTQARAGYEAAIGRIEAGGQQFGWPYQKLAELLIPTDLPAALRYAQKAVDLEPAVESNHLVLAKACESAGNFDAAIEEYFEAARLKPNEASIRYLLFRLYRKKGDNSAATEQLRLHEKLRAIYVSKQ